MTVNTDIYRFGSYVLNPGLRELRNSGVRVEIEPRAFELLIFLIANHDRAVDKNEIQDAVWPEMIVTETALTRAVMKARKAIDDDASRQEKIRTIHGHGYRFVAQVSNVDSTPTLSEREVSHQSQTENEVSEKPAAAKRNWRAMGMAVVALVIATSLAWVLLRTPTVLSNEMRIAVLPLQDNTGDQELAWTRFGLMSYANELIGNEGSMEVVKAGNIIGLAENFGWSGNLDDPENQELIDKLKEVFAATHILAMELEPDKGALRINYSLLVPDGNIKMGTIVGDSSTNLAQGVVQAVYGSVLRKSHLGGTTLVSKDAFNNEAFARGMDLSLQGRCSEATQYFRVIVEQEPSLFEPRFELAACLRILGEQDEAESLLSTLVTEQRLLGSGAQLAESLMTLGVLYYRTGRHDQAESSYDEALKVSTQLGTHELSARILQNQAILFKNRSELDKASTLLDLALLAYQDAGLEILPGFLYSGRANLRMARGELVEADIELQQALEAFREIGDRRNEAKMLNNTGFLRRLQGKMEEAEAYHLRSIEIREEIGDRVGVGRSYGMLSIVYTSRGEYENAKMAVGRAREIAQDTHDSLFEATSLAQLASAEKELGDLEAARLHYLEGRSIFEAIQDHLRVMQSDLLIAGLDLDAKQYEQAGQTALRVLTTSREQNIMQPEVEALELLGDVEMALDNTKSAIAEYTAAIDRLQETSWSSKQNTVMVKLANAYMDEADLQAAAPLMGALAGDSSNVSSLMVRARFNFLRGDAGKAVELMSEAKLLAGPAWIDDNEAMLKQYTDSQTP